MPDTIFAYSYPDLSNEATLEDYYALINDPNYLYDSTYNIDQGIGAINDSIHYISNGGLWKIGLYSQIKYRF